MKTLSKNCYVLSLAFLFGMQFAIAQNKNSQNSRKRLPPKVEKSVEKLAPSASANSKPAVVVPEKKIFINFSTEGENTQNQGTVVDESSAFRAQREAEQKLKELTQESPLPQPPSLNSDPQPPDGVLSLRPTPDLPKQLSSSPQQDLKKTEGLRSRMSSWWSSSKDQSSIKAQIGWSQSNYTSESYRIGVEGNQLGLGLNLQHPDGQGELLEISWTEIVGGSERGWTQIATTDTAKISEFSTTLFLGETRTLGLSGTKKLLQIFNKDSDLAEWQETAVGLTYQASISGSAKLKLRYAPQVWHKMQMRYEMAPLGYNPKSQEISLFWQKQLSQTDTYRSTVEVSMSRRKSIWQGLHGLGQQESVQDSFLVGLNGTKG